ncbi:PINIT domain-containing protein [Pilobolus umbonatus]|nr:PINIT domain-containing protein [Pilobolus umbonatus]
MKYSATLQAIQRDLNGITIKEITGCIQGINSVIGGHPVLQKGRKQEKVNRLSEYILDLLKNENEIDLKKVVTVVTEESNFKISWRVEDHELKFSKESIPKPAAKFNPLTFRPSPFYGITVFLTKYLVCPVSRPHERRSVTLEFMLTDEQRELLSIIDPADNLPSYQIRFFCAKYHDGQMQNLLLEFPSICELRVNANVIVGSSLKGLKGRPGTVNPADITVMSRKTSLNRVELLYMNTECQYVITIALVKRVAIPSLIQRLMNENRVSKEAVLAKLQETQQDIDIVMEAETLSTKCPLAFTRINIPCRSVACHHLQCYDATAFLLMNEQTPTWACPVCNRRIEKWQDLILDEYFLMMLQNTPAHIEHVRVQPNGNMVIIDEHILSEQEDDDYDERSIVLVEDDIKIPSPHYTHSRYTPLSPPQLPLPPYVPLVPAQPLLVSRGKMAAPPSPEMTGPPKKKSHVIDLTLDSEEEE